jgi:GH18 family chitinase
MKKILLLLIFLTSFAFGQVDNFNRANTTDISGTNKWSAITSAPGTIGIKDSIARGYCTADTFGLVGWDTTFNITDNPRIGFIPKPPSATPGAGKSWKLRIWGGDGFNYTTNTTGLGVTLTKDEWNQYYFSPFWKSGTQAYDGLAWSLVSWNGTTDTCWIQWKGDSLIGLKNTTRITVSTGAGVVDSRGHNTFKVVIQADTGRWGFDDFFVNTAGAPAAQPPTVTTNTVNIYGYDTARVSGTCNPNGTETDTWYQYSTSSIFATYDTTDAVNIGDGIGVIADTVTLSGLDSGITYYFRKVGESSVGTTYGTTRNFTTLIDIDNQNPVLVSLTSTPTYVNASEPIFFTARVTDNYGLDSLIIRLETVAGVQVDSFKYKLMGTKDTTITTSSKTYPVADYQYYCYVKDDTGNVYNSLKFGLSVQSDMVVLGYYTNHSFCDVQPQEFDWSFLTHLVWFTSEPSYDYPYARELVNSTLGRSDSAIIETGGSDLTGTWRGWCYNSLSNYNTNGITHLSVARDSANKYGVKMILCLGGEYGTPATMMNWIVADTTRQDVYIDHVFEYMKRKGFQGVDLDWEYPLASQKALSDRFLSKWRQKLNTMDPPGFLSMCFDLRYSTYENLITPDTANNTLDAFNLMFYGLYTDAYPKSAHNSPLHASVPSTGGGVWDTYLANYFVGKGFDKSKFIMLATFELCHWYGVDNVNQTMVSGPAWERYINLTTARTQNPSASPGYVWDDSAKVPIFGYTASGTKHFFSYEDSLSLFWKVQQVKSDSISGIGIWDFAYRGYNGVSDKTPQWKWFKAAVGKTANPLSIPRIPILSTPANGASLSSFATSLNWSSSLGATLYRVQLDTVNTFNSVYLKEATPSINTLQINTTWGGLDASKTHYWRVKAVNTLGDSGYSSTFNFTIQETVEPPILNQPVLISPDSGAINVLPTGYLTWYAVYQADYYSIQIDTTSLFTPAIYNISYSGTSMPLYPVTTLTVGKTYYWRVRAVKTTGGISVPSTTWSFTVASVPSAPTLVYPTNNMANTPLAFSFKWTKSAYATSYTCQIATDILFTSVFGGGVGLTDTVRIIDDDSFEQDTKYYWRVNAANAAGASAWSSIDSFTTILNPVASVVTLVSPANDTTGVKTSVYLYWTSTGGATKYHIQIGRDDTVAVTPFSDSSITYSPYYYTGLYTSRNYFWRVRAKNSTGWGDWTSWWNFTTVDSSALIEDPQALLVWYDVANGKFVYKTPPPELVVQNKGDNVYQPKSESVVTIGANGVTTSEGKAYSPIYLSPVWRLRLDPLTNTVRMEYLSGTMWIIAPMNSSGAWTAP